MEHPKRRRLLASSRQPQASHPERTEDVIEGVNQPSEKLIVVSGTDSISLNMQDNTTLLFNVLLCCKEDDRLSSESFEWLLGANESRSLHALAAFGEMVGALAAQSIGAYCSALTQAKILLEYTTLARITAATEILYDPVDLESNHYTALVLRVCVVNDNETNVQNTKDNTVAQDDEFLKKIEQNMLGEMVLGDVSDIKKVFIKSDKRQRNAHFKELRAVTSFDGSYVNYRHLVILSDVMIYRGHSMSIPRHGINRVETGPLMRCFFEETAEILFGVPPLTLPLMSTVLPSDRTR
ncbi:RNA polymerase II largest subunit [Planoprotostelium fungivorum]|uniref:DNA-directed RNA polymerase n=1 Tax=Planoprotostelium fungivorum TaxID=1890364 RepID=A0A2P6MV55_9EUKA|nr:RNA polymerase II largest subunit [Planoprotostelium fungivorum]